MSGLAILRASRMQVGRLLAQSGLVGGLLRGPTSSLAADTNLTNPTVPETLRSQLFPGPTSLLAFRTIIAPSGMVSSLQVHVPALGESITDGTVATILKQQGDTVEEDEPILQIETDKVTIDVRAPKAGVLEAILVQEDDNVNVGHLVAVIAEGATASASKTAAAALPEPPSATPTTTPLPATAPTPAITPLKAPASALATSSGRQPSIQFPPRRTASGDVISMMPAAEAAAAEEAARPKRMTAPQPQSHFFIKLPPRPAGPPPKARKDLSDWEMEQIMLGGADCVA